MNQIMMDIWPYLVAPIAGAIGWLFREVYVLKMEISVLKQSIEGLQTTIQNDIINIERTIEKMQNRLDSHSKKQDDILNRISSMERELLKQMGDMATSLAGFAADLRALSNFISVSDIGLKINHQQ